MKIEFQDCGNTYDHGPAWSGKRKRGCAKPHWWQWISMHFNWSNDLPPSNKCHHGFMLQIYLRDHWYRVLFRTKLLKKFVKFR